LAIFDYAIARRFFAAVICAAVSSRSLIRLPLMPHGGADGDQRCPHPAAPHARDGATGLRRVIPGRAGGARAQGHPRTVISGARQRREPRMAGHVEISLKLAAYTQAALVK